MIVLIYVCDAVMGTGKAQPLSEPVLTSCGYVPMGSIKPGMMVYGEDGELHKVLKVFPQGLKYTYRVKFSDGGFTNCCNEHLWTYKEYDDTEWATTSLGCIMNNRLFRLRLLGGIQWRYQIPVCKAIRYSYQPLPVPPEKLGILLNYDPELDITNGLSNLDEDTLYDLRKRRIPKCYLRTQISDRIILLDTLVSAYRNKTGAFADEQFTFTTKSIALAESVKDLVDGLGGLAHVPVERKSKKTSEVFYDVVIGFGDEYTKRYITSIVKNGLEECQCILVDSAAHLYITKDHIVTHNTSAAITYMNQHPSEKYIYVTPYLNEARRIKEKCPSLHFIEPNAKIPDFDFSKLTHSTSLIEQGRNITTTHAAFRNYSPEMLSIIRKQGYTLFIDENLSILEETPYKATDLQLLVTGGYLKEEDGRFYKLDKAYDGEVLSKVFNLMESRYLMRLANNSEDNQGNDDILFYWMLPPDLIGSFKNVFVLTYLFEGQGLYHFFNIYDIPYKNIGVRRFGSSTFAFCDGESYRPEYLSRLSEMIDIVDNQKLNKIGDAPYALSMSWFEREGKKGVAQLKNNINNLFRNVWKNSNKDNRLWGTFASPKDKLKGKGYTKNYLVFNARATNQYKDTKYLVYAVNLFVNVKEKLFYKLRGAEMSDDVFALSTMIQWIWRSGIRDGKKIHIYIPSRRMRQLLIDWINSFDYGEGGEENV